jgi:hypothetical protein
MSYKYLIVGAVVLFLVFVGIDIGSRYFGKERPFTKGLYRKSLSGHITSISEYKAEMTIYLSMSDSAYSFLPSPEHARSSLYFWDAVKKGDSLWKSPMSDTIYTLGTNGIEYQWLFKTRDKFGRSYLEEE